MKERTIEEEIIIETIEAIQIDIIIKRKFNQTLQKKILENLTEKCMKKALVIHQILPVH